MFKIARRGNLLALGQIPNVSQNCGIVTAKRLFHKLKRIFYFFVKDCTDGDDEPGRDVCGYI